MNSLKKMKDNVIFLSVHLLKGSYMICMFLLSSLYFFNRVSAHVSFILTRQIVFECSFLDGLLALGGGSSRSIVLV